MEGCNQKMEKLKLKEKEEDDSEEKKKGSVGVGVVYYEDSEGVVDDEDEDDWEGGVEDDDDEDEDEEEEGGDDEEAEQTFVLLYSGAGKYTGVVVSVIEQRNCTLKGFKLMNVGEKFATKFMDSIWDDSWWGDTKEERIKELCLDSVLPMVFEGKRAVSKLKRLFNGKKLVEGISFNRFMLYRSDSVEKAKMDIKLWFPDTKDSSDEYDKVEAAFMFRNGNHINLDKYYQQNATPEMIHRAYFREEQSFILIKDAAVKKRIVGRIIDLLQFHRGVVKGFKMSNMDGAFCLESTCGIVNDNSPVGVAVVWDGDIHNIIKVTNGKDRDYYKFDGESAVFGRNLLYVCNSNTLSTYIESWFPHGLVLWPGRFGLVYDANLYTDTKFLKDARSVGVVS